MEGNGKKAIGETRIETQVLRKRLLSAVEGEIVTYSELNALVGMDVQTKARHLLHTAIKQTEAENKCLFGCINGEGYKRLPPNAQVEEIDRSRQYIRRKSKRELKRSHNVEWDKLDGEQRAKLNSTRTLLHFVSHSTTDMQRSKLETVVANTGDALPFAKVLEHFGK